MSKPNLNTFLRTPNREPDVKCKSMHNEEHFWFDEMISAEYVEHIVEPCIKKITITGTEVFITECNHDNQPYETSSEYATAVLKLYNDYLVENILLGED